MTLSKHLRFDILHYRFQRITIPSHFRLHSGETATVEEIKEFCKGEVCLRFIFPFSFPGFFYTTSGGVGDKSLERGWMIPWRLWCKIYNSSGGYMRGKRLAVSINKKIQYKKQLAQALDATHLSINSARDKSSVRQEFTAHIDPSHVTSMPSCRYC